MRSCVRVNRHIQRDDPCQIVIDVIKHDICEHKILLVHNYRRDKVLVLIVRIAKCGKS